MRTLKITAIICLHAKGEPIIEIDLSTWQVSIIRPESFLTQWEEDVRLENPQDVEIGKLYQLVISSNDHSLSGRYIEQTNRPSENKDDT